MIGAGPYGLATAAHLADAGLDVRAFGEPMESWANHMPAGMVLRSLPSASNIADPRHALGLADYEATRGLTPERLVPLDRFVTYGRWYQERAVPFLARTRVVSVTRNGSFHLRTGEGGDLRADAVVVAAGIVPFARRPVAFDHLPRELVSHPSDHCDLRAFAGQRVAVVGGGQSALESAALLAEAGAAVRVITRHPVFWLSEPARSSSEVQVPLRQYAFQRTALGGPRSSWLAARPTACRLLPPRARQSFTDRLSRPAGAHWLRARLASVPIHEGVEVVACTVDDGALRLRLSDGSRHGADHLLLATGYEVDLARYGFLAPALRREIRTLNGSPILTTGFESSVRGLYFVGATAAASFGPVLRFVCGTWAAARGVTRAIVGRSAPRAGFSW